MLVAFFVTWSAITNYHYYKNAEYSFDKKQKTNKLDAAYSDALSLKTNYNKAMMLKMRENLDKNRVNFEYSDVNLIISNTLVKSSKYEDCTGSVFIKALGGDNYSYSPYANCNQEFEKGINAEYLKFDGNIGRVFDMGNGFIFTHYVEVDDSEDSFTNRNISISFYTYDGHEVWEKENIEFVYSEKVKNPFIMDIKNIGDKYIVIVSYDTEYYIDNYVFQFSLDFEFEKELVIDYKGYSNAINLGNDYLTTIGDKIYYGVQSSSQNTDIINGIVEISLDSGTGEFYNFDDKVIYNMDENGIVYSGKVNFDNNDDEKNTVDVYLTTLQNVPLEEVEFDCTEEETIIHSIYFNNKNIYIATYNHLYKTDVNLDDLVEVEFKKFIENDNDVELVDLLFEDNAVIYSLYSHTTFKQYIVKEDNVSDSIDDIKVFETKDSVKGFSVKNYVSDYYYKDEELIHIYDDSKSDGVLLVRFIN